jgi:uncharacterized phage protein (TIGR01671 family)
MKIENIKFKAKRLDNGELVYGSLIRSTAGIKERAYIVDNFSSMSDYSVIGIDHSTICQFTGLKDKNGTPIYEGDIVIYKDNNAERRGAIVWDNESIAFCFEKGFFLCHFPSKNMVVVGNKFDKNK